MNSLDPFWNESFRIEVCHAAEGLAFEVRDKDHAYAEFIGTVYIPVSGGLLVRKGLTTSCLYNKTAAGKIAINLIRLNSTEESSGGNASSSNIAVQI